MKLTEHFYDYEVTETRAPYINSITDKKIIKNVYTTAKILEIIRIANKLPIEINSWYRCTYVNKYVRGVENSYHLKGLAVDIPNYCITIDGRNFIEALFNARVIIEMIPHKSYTHIAVNPLLTDLININEYVEKID